MPAKQILQSEKYLSNDVKLMEKRAAMAKNDKAVKDFTTFLMGMLFVLIGIFAIQYADVWVPQAKLFLRSLRS